MRVLGVLIVAVGTCLALVFIGGGADTKGMVTPALLIAGCGVALFLVGAKKSKTKREVKQARSELEDAYREINSDAALMECVCDIPVVSSGVPIFLAKEEQAYINFPCTLLITKERAIGRTGGYGGASVRVAKGVTLHTGTTGGRTVYGDVTQRFGGTLVVTSQRLVFLNEQKGFECKLKDISSLQAYGGDTITMLAKNKNYALDVCAAQYIAKVISLLREE